MAKKKQSKKIIDDLSSENNIKSFFQNETVHFIIGLILVIFAAYLVLSFVSFFFTGGTDQSLLESGNPRDLTAVTNKVQNYGGPLGAQLANYLINECFGLASIFIIIFLFVVGINMMRIKKSNLWRWFINCSLLLVWFSVFLGFAFRSIYEDTFFYLGGMHGYYVGRWLASQVGVPGVWMILLITAVCLALFFKALSVDSMRKAMTLKFFRKSKSDKSDDGSDTLVDEVSDADDIAVKEAGEQVVRFRKRGSDFNPIQEADEPDDVEDAEELPLSGPAKAEAAMPSEPSFEVSVATGDKDEISKKQDVQPYNPKLDLENYHYPTLNLLKHFDDDEPLINMEEQNENKSRIIKTLRSFGIEISTIKATVGPTVTLYEITPVQGIRISKIRGLEDDIALSLSALGIRIIAPIPGKGTIGIEVPNKKPRIVSGQSIIGSKKFQESTYDLPIALGKTITNEVFMVDLCKMPHILVAGATGQGKSVGLNAIITSLLYKKHPAELKFVLVDPKKVEFSIYSEIENHFLAKLPGDGDPIITDVTKVVQTLNSICSEMDTRYDLLKLAHVRNVKEYNQKFTERKLNPEKGHKYMPYIVVVIDEFCDLIMTAGKEIELPIARIAQLARAVGIHMVIATQRPTTNIITGTIKANFPARIAFRVSSSVDSRTILDRTGANQLIGRGDMLFLQGNDPIRVQCAFIDTPEVVDITKYISQQQGYTTPFYLPEYVGEDKGFSDSNDIEKDHLDSLFEEAARLIVIHQQGSTSLIQRKFSIGYNRAGRLMDQLEKAGIVGPIQGSKPRDVLCVDENDLQMKLDNILR